MSIQVSNVAGLSNHWDTIYHATALIQVAAADYKGADCSCGRTAAARFAERITNAVSEFIAETQSHTVETRLMDAFTAHAGVTYKTDTRDDIGQVLADGFLKLGPDGLAALLANGGSAGGFVYDGEDLTVGDVRAASPDSAKLAAVLWNQLDEPTQEGFADDMGYSLDNMKLFMSGERSIPANIAAMLIDEYGRDFPNRESLKQAASDEVNAIGNEAVRQLQENAPDVARVVTNGLTAQKLLTGFDSSALQVFASETGVTRRTVDRWISGERAIPADIAARIVAGSYN